MVLFLNRDVLSIVSIILRGVCWPIVFLSFFSGDSYPTDFGVLVDRAERMCFVVDGESETREIAVGIGSSGAV